MKPYVCVVGAVNLDICGRPEKKLIFRDSNPGAVTLTPGGVGRNIAHDLRLLGVEVKFLTAFGGDSHAQLLRNDCVELGMDLSCALDVPGGRTSTYLYITDERGEMQLGLCDTDISAAITPDVSPAAISMCSTARPPSCIDGNLTSRDHHLAGYALQRPRSLPTPSPSRRRSGCAPHSAHCTRSSPTSPRDRTSRASPRLRAWSRRCWRRACSACSSAWGPRASSPATRAETGAPAVPAHLHGQHDRRGRRGHGGARLGVSRRARPA